MGDWSKLSRRTCFDIRFKYLELSKYLIAMDNKNNRSFYWEVKDFLNKKPETFEPKKHSLKESISGILNENKIFRQSSYIEETHATQDVSKYLRAWTGEEKKYTPKNISYAKNSLANPFQLINEIAINNQTTATNVYGQPTRSHQRADGTWEDDEGNLVGSSVDPNSPNFDAFPGSEGFYDRQWFAMDLSSGANANTLYASFIYFNTPTESPSLTGSTIKKLQSGGTSFGNKIQAISGSIQFNNVRVDNAGVLHLTGADIDNNSVIYCKSTDGGNTFSAPITIATGTNLFGSQGNGYIHDRENAATNMEVDGAKHVHVVWSDFSVTPDANYKSFYSRLNNGGSSFSTPIDLSTLFIAGNNVLMPVVSTAGNQVTIGAYVIDASKVSDYYIINSQDNGNTWSAPIKLSSVSTDFASASNTGAWFGDYANAVRTDTKVYTIWSDGRSAGGPKMYVNTTTLWATPTTDITPINSSLQLNNLYPNPVNSVLNLQFNVQKQDNIVVHVLSIDGKEILTQHHTLSAGKQAVTLQVSDLATGHYVLQITNQDGFDIVRHFVKK